MLCLRCSDAAKALVCLSIPFQLPVQSIALQDLLQKKELHPRQNQYTRLNQMFKQVQSAIGEYRHTPIK